MDERWRQEQKKKEMNALAHKMSRTSKRNTAKPSEVVPGDGFGESEDDDDEFGKKEDVEDDDDRDDNDRDDNDRDDDHDSDTKEDESGRKNEGFSREGSDNDEEDFGEVQGDLVDDMVCHDRIHERY